MVPSLSRLDQQCKDYISAHQKIAAPFIAPIENHSANMLEEGLRSYLVRYQALPSI